MRYSLKIFICIIFIFSFSFLAFSYWAIREVRGHYSVTIEDSLVDFSNLLGAYLSSEVIDGNINVTDFEKAFVRFKDLNIFANINGVLKGSSPIDAYVTDGLGKVIFDSRGAKNIGKDYSLWNDVYLTLQGKYGARSTRMKSDDPLTSYYYVAAPIKYKNKIIGVVSVIKPEQSLAEFINKGRIKIIIVTLLILILTTALAGLFSFWLTRPINALISYAQLVKEGGSPRPPRSSTKEFKRLALAFDEMRISLEGRKSVENFIQNLVHELKSPLAAILGATEILRDEVSEAQKKLFLDNIEVESKRAKQQLEELLNIAAIENQTELRENEIIYVERVLGELRNSYRALIQKKNLDFQVKMGLDGLSVMGEEKLFFRALSSLLMNAIEFSPENGKLLVEVTKTNSAYEIWFRDQGSGIPEFAREQVFQKFYSLERPETGKKSSGLGLSFAREVIRLHSGEITLGEPSEDWPGANILITLDQD